MRSATALIFLAGLAATGCAVDLAADERALHELWDEFERAFNAGDIEQYEGLVAQHHVELEAQPALLSNTNFLKEKITLMSGD